MSTTSQIKALSRDVRNKKTLKQTRDSDMVPAVIYGPKHKNLHIYVPLEKVPRSRDDTNVVQIDIEQNKVMAVVRYVTPDVVTGLPLHVDYMYANPDDYVNVRVNIHYINSTISPGLRYGGFLNIIKRSLLVRCKPIDLPKRIVVDLQHRETGEKITVADIKDQIKGSAIFLKAKDSDKIAILASKK